MRFKCVLNKNTNPDSMTQTQKFKKKKKTVNQKPTKSTTICLNHPTSITKQHSTNQTIDHHKAYRKPNHQPKIHKLHHQTTDPQQTQKKKKKPDPLCFSLSNLDNLLSINKKKNCNIVITHS